MPSTALPSDETIQNRDGTKTIISYRLNENGQTVKTTRRIRLITHREVVNPRVAERKKWSKFGLSGSDPAGPAADTTSVGENIIFRPSANWKQEAKDESKDPNAQSMKDKLKDKKVKCRICSQEHFTARCPYKETMAPVGEAANADVAAGLGDEDAPAAAGGAGNKKGSYVPPALRNGGARGEGERMGGGKFGERDDFATLRVTNVCVFIFVSLSLSFLPYLLITLYVSHVCACADLPSPRSPRWQRSRSCATCSSASAASRACSWPRTGRRAAQRASPSSASRTGPTPRGRAARWTASASSISSSRSSLRRRPPKRLLGSWIRNGGGGRLHRDIGSLKWMIWPFRAAHFDGLNGFRRRSQGDHVVFGEGLASLWRSLLGRGVGMREMSSRAWRGAGDNCCSPGYGDNENSRAGQVREIIRRRPVCGRVTGKWTLWVSGTCVYVFVHIVVNSMVNLISAPSTTRYYSVS